MEFIVKLLNKIMGSYPTTTQAAVITQNNTAPSIMPKSKKTPVQGEIKMYSEMTDEQIHIREQRAQYIQYINNPNYKVKKNDTLEKIAKKFNVTTTALMELNGMNEKSVITPGQNLKIPPTRKFKNIKNINDIARAMGVSPEFIKSFKRIEDSQKLPDNKFHNKPYKDSNGVLTIGIGHAVKPGEKQELTDSEVCELCVKDLYEAEDSIIGKIGRKDYEKLPVSIKEALLDMVFNKGPNILDKCNGIIYCLKNEKYEAAINKMTYNVASKTKKEMSGLSKRRLFDISIAIKGYKNGKIPQSNINTAQQVYNRGVELLRIECKEKNLNFKNQIVGYNKDIQGYFGNKIKLKYINE